MTHTHSNQSKPLRTTLINSQPVCFFDAPDAQSVFLTLTQKVLSRADHHHFALRATFNGSGGEG
ncbi:hypothetical protein HK25_12155 [Acetobacter sp. DsW_059]|nr:hypothetical protein HK25_12155 [Acetobacter sp. DsW_059]